MNKIHDGDRVRIALAEQGETQTALALFMGVARSTVSKMLSRESWTTDDLKVAGTFLNRNFFDVYGEGDIDLI